MRKGAEKNSTKPSTSFSFHHQNILIFKSRKVLSKIYWRGLKKEKNKFLELPQVTEYKVMEDYLKYFCD